MPRFAANLSFLYQEHSFLDRFAAAAEDGFRAVEYLGPYAESKDRVAETLEQHGLTQELGCEYKPRTTTTEGLGWLAQYR